MIRTLFKRTLSSFTRRYNCEKSSLYQLWTDIYDTKTLYTTKECYITNKKYINLKPQLKTTDDYFFLKKFLETKLENDITIHLNNPSMNLVLNFVGSNAKFIVDRANLFKIDEKLLFSENINIKSINLSTDEDFNNFSEKSTLISNTLKDYSLIIDREYDLVNYKFLEQYPILKIHTYYNPTNDITLLNKSIINEVFFSNLKNGYDNEHFEKYVKIRPTINRFVNYKKLLTLHYSSCLGKNGLLTLECDYFD
jgi:hypothetical protein